MRMRFWCNIATRDPLPQGTSGRVLRRRAYRTCGRRDPLRCRSGQLQLPERRRGNGCARQVAPATICCRRGGERHHGAKRTRSRATHTQASLAGRRVVRWLRLNSVDAVGELSAHNRVSAHLRHERGGRGVTNRAHGAASTARRAAPVPRGIVDRPSGGARGSRQ